MPLVVMSFFGDSAGAPVGGADLERAYETARSMFPSGCKVEVRALDRTFLDCYYSPGEKPLVILDDPDSLPPTVSSAVVSVWMDDGIDNLELVTQELSRKLHDELRAIGTGTFHARRHLDLVGDGPAPRLQAVAVIERRPDLDRDTFIQYYRTHHVPLAKRLKPRFVRYTTFRTLETLGEFSGDCVTIQEYPSIDELNQHLRTRTSDGDSAGEDIENFIKHLTYNIGERTVY